MRCLDQKQFRIPLEMANCILKKIGRWGVIGIKYSDQIAVGAFQTRIEVSCFCALIQSAGQIMHTKFVAKALNSARRARASSALTGSGSLHF